MKPSLTKINMKILRSAVSGSIIIPLMFLSAGCSLLGTSAPSVAGVVKTVNGGADWLFSNSIAGDKTASLSGSNISKLAFDPQNREIVFAGSYTDGLYKSEDSGATWTKILSKIAVYDFIINPGDSKTIYAAGSYNDQGKVLKTTDGGASWQQIYNDAVASNPVRVIAFNSTSPNQLVIGTANGSLIQSFDEGMSWKLLTDFNNQIKRVYWLGNSIYVLLKDKGLFKSAAIGEPFTSLTDSVSKQASTNYSYSDQFAYNQAYLDPVAGNLMYVSTTAGLYKSVDGGGSWTPIILPIPISQSNVHAIAVAQSSSNIVYTSVGAVIYKSTDAGSNWQTQGVATSGFINYILIDPQLPQIAYGGIYAGQQ